MNQQYEDQVPKCIDSAAVLDLGRFSQLTGKDRVGPKGSLVEVQAFPHLRSQESRCRSGAAAATNRQQKCQPRSTSRHCFRCIGTAFLGWWSLLRLEESVLLAPGYRLFCGVLIFRTTFYWPTFGLHIALRPGSDFMRYAKVDPASPSIEARIRFSDSHVSTGISTAEICLRSVRHTP